MAVKQVLNVIGNKICKIFKDPSIKNYRSDSHETSFSDLAFGDPLSSFYRYEAYDPGSEIFYNQNSSGFVIESVPLVGSDFASQKEISSIFEEVLQEGDSIQCFLLADHRVDPFLSSWERPRKDGEDIYAKIAHHRKQHFKDSKKLSPRIFRFILSYSAKGKEQHSVNALLEKKAIIKKILSSLTYTFVWGPNELINTISSILNFSFSKEKKKHRWNPCERLSSQMSSGGSLHVKKNSILWEEDPAVFKTYRVVKFPESWSLNAMQDLIGHASRESFRINSPFFMHFGVHCPKQSTEEGKFWRRSQFLEKQAQSSFLMRVIHHLGEEVLESRAVKSFIEEGGKFVWTQFSLGMWEKESKFNAAEQSLKSVFRLNGFSLAENTYVHLPQLLSSLPLMWSEYIEDLKKFDLLRTTISSECRNLVPIQGEWIGTRSPGMLFIGRRGQLLNWNPFDNQSGNYNISVFGKSGSGKSVFMQELLMSGLSTGAKVFVLDVGRSFEKMCDLVGGQSIQFSKNSSIRLNPFSKIPKSKEEREDSLAFLKKVISCMAAPRTGTNELQESLIEKAIYHAWEKRENRATITDVSDFLLAEESEIARNIGTMLIPYTRKGLYGKYFEGESNVSFKNPMILIELEELKEKKDLQSVVLQLFVMAITNEVFLGDRKTPFFICIDEAWDLLRAKQMKEFIETLARRLRKYNGSLIVGTQSVEDFFNNPGAKAAFDNSDWTLVLSQKKEAIDELTKSGKFSGKRAAMESLRTLVGEYSEVLIVNCDGNFSIAQLVLDPFSQLLYTTKAQEYAEIKELTREGLSISDAIKILLERRKN